MKPSPELLSIIHLGGCTKEKIEEILNISPREYQSKEQILADILQNETKGRFSPEVVSYIANSLWASPEYYHEIAKRLP